MQRRHFVASFAGLAFVARSAHAHHGWSGFDQDKPLYLEGTADKVVWQNPHAELMLRVAPALKLPDDLAQRALPAQTATLGGPRLLAAARLPTRREPVWELELAPLTRMEAWRVAEIKPGQPVAVIGYAAPGEKGEAVMRVEYLFVAGKAYGLRSSPA